MSEHQHLTELEGDAVDKLAERARESEYLTRLESYLADEHGETRPSDTVRAYERDDGLRLVSFAEGADEGDRPAVAITVQLDGQAVVGATAERHGEAVDGTMELAFPAETAPPPEQAVQDLFAAEGQSVEVTVDEGEDVTSYTLEV